MIVKFFSNIHDIGQQRWNNISGIESPFLRFEFHAALESNHCVGQNAGWLPQHLAAEDTESGQLLGLMPLYIKSNSYGELVFDISWAEAYLQAGRAYYPKLVSAIPFTPAPGKRMLIAKHADPAEIKRAMIAALAKAAKNNSLSSIHCLFHHEEDNPYFEEQEFFTRLGCQFHWHNKTFDNFDHFLSTFSSRKRKNILKERKRCNEQGVSFQTLTGNQVGPHLWPIIYHFYQKTFLEKGGYPSFTQAFFQEIARTMGEQLLVILAHFRGKIIACAICYQNNSTLYGRHWGSSENLDSLHFETCYYQGIEHAIKHGLKRFEPGAQGEHKISRGFIPTKTWSAHWIGDEHFRSIISNHVEHEKIHMLQYINDMNKHSPFKHL